MPHKDHIRSSSDADEDTVITNLKIKNGLNKNASTHAGDRNFPRVQQMDLNSSTHSYG